MEKEKYDFDELDKLMLELVELHRTFKSLPEETQLIIKNYLIQKQETVKLCLENSINLLTK